MQQFIKQTCHDNKPETKIMYIKLDPILMYKLFKIHSYT